jgi:hypothetical protein
VPLPILTKFSRATFVDLSSFPIAYLARFALRVLRTSRCSGPTITKRGKKRGQANSWRQEEISFVADTAHYSHTLTWSLFGKCTPCASAARVNALSFDSPRLLAGSLPPEKGRKSRAVMFAHMCTHVCTLTWFTQAGGGSEEREEKRKRERESGERICRSDWIRGYGSSNKVITRTRKPLEQ